MTISNHFRFIILSGVIFLTWLSPLNAQTNCESRFRQAQEAQYNHQHEKAVQYYQQNIEACQEEALISSLNNLGQLYRMQGQYAEAEPLLEQALTLRKQLYGEEHEYVAYSLNELANLYIAMEDFDKAEPLLNQALKIKEQQFGEGSPEIINTLNSLALLYTNTARYAEAEPFYQRSIVITENLGEDSLKLATSLNNLANLYIKLGDYDRVEPILKKSLRIREKHLGQSHPRLANTLALLAFLYQHQQKFDKAEEKYKEALAIWRSHYDEQHPAIATGLNNLATLYRSQGKEKQAEALHQHVLALRERMLGADHPRVANSLNNLAVLYERAQDYEQAELLYQRALYIAFNHDQPELLWLVLTNLSDLLANQGHIEAAIFFRKQAVNTLQSLRVAITDMDKELRESFLKNKVGVYEKLADLLMEEGRLLEAQQTIMMLKEETYFDFIDRAAGSEVRETESHYNPTEAQWAETYQTLTRRIGHLYQQLKALDKKNPLNEQEKTKYSQLKEQIAEQEAQLMVYLQKLKAQSDKTSDDIGEKNLQQLQKIQHILESLEHQAVIIHYLMRPEKLRIIITTRNQQIARETDITKIELNRQILEFHKALQDPVEAPIKQAHQLYQSIIQPIEKDLETMQAQTLMLSLDSTLHYVPVAALFDGEKYLAEKYAIVTYNEAAHETVTIPPTPQWKLIGFGLSKEVTGFSPLPTVDQELNNIIRTDETDVGVLEGEFFLNEDFTNEKMLEMLKKNYPVMHIASHFVFTPGTQKDSFLLLGNGGKLTLAELRERDYRFDHLDLLTLSACDTAMGELANGREIEGFGTLAQKQGAKAVLATLWPVNDESTGLFMQHFYKLRTEQNLTKVEALQQTQQAFIQGKKTEDGYYFSYYQSPYYWAPFILMGNWL